ncbi:unnamed protein product [Notodromas monacha]|uniref:Uncharacterized protein n=1 Tax=Notodromas monacha TaxID=399045 RepID=A0A7R9BLG8_9CRUS|nr:unnamed protein product [Notodromas monacha]CAG0917667.1 unnamed protein product [Notodromas monacha]
MRSFREGTLCRFDFLGINDVGMLGKSEHDGGNMKRTQVLVNFITAFGLVYTCSGGAQVIGGIYFVFILPTFETWSNIWTGLWILKHGKTSENAKKEDLE